ncbi:MAG: DUF3883 domain-containing protein [Clostridia bacterium]|nr:DUF3883 domain-containing protein [Clostridia bacterium]MBQ7873530.1 DUF3883 domain-containing protein [Clostridia bacterium]
MTEFEIIQKEIDSIEQKYLRSAMDIISDHNTENKTKTDYKRRQIYELLQNADDCYSKEFPQISVRMELRNNLLIIQNTGVPFSARGVLSLMHTDASSKHEGTIGCKGLGFRSVLNWANRISVYTSEFYVDFSEERAVRNLGYYKQQSHAYGSEELDRLSRTAILTAAEVYNDKAEISKWLSPEYSTAIVLYCDDAYLDEIRNQLINLKFEELLFLQYVNTIEIITSEATRKIESIKENELCIIQEGDSISQWRVWSRQGELTQENGETKKYELIIAYNDDATERETIRENGVLYSYFKTDIPMSFPFLIHGTFELTSERNSLVKDNLFNEMILERLIDFIGEIGEGLVYDSDKCDYEALRFLLPSESLGQLDREYNFTSRLKEKIREYKIFPTINEEYISISESPKYSRRRFDEILLSSTCRTLLKHAPDEYIVDYISESGIKFYSDKELVELINQDAHHYVDSNLNAELIALYYEAYPYSQVAPKLLTDSKGNLILDGNVKIFDNPTQRFDLPEWSKMYFLNPELETTLSKRLRTQGRNLTDKLKSFNVVEYSFNRVLAELVSQSKEDLEKTKGTLAWLYEYWEQNNRSFPSGFGNTDIRIVSRNNEIVGISKCYIGKEYGNELGERLTSFLENTIYVGALEQIGLSDKNIEDVKTFIYALGIKQYPAIETVKLDYQEENAYIKYNSQKHPYFFDNRNERFNHVSYFSQWGKEIIVSSIKGIDEILGGADFYDIICWLLCDGELYEAVMSENEISDAAVMKGRPPRVQYSREVRKNYMASWLRKIFTEAKWLPTLSKQKVEVGNCTLFAHKLSPIVEVLDIDYVKLIDKSGKSRKEIDLLFEKLGIVEDVVDLAPQKIYEILLGLYTNKAEPTVTKQIYTKLNLKYKAETIGGLINNNPMYEKFKSEGGVLAELNGEYVYLPVRDVYYVDKKIYSEDILKNYPLLVLGKRAGASKIQKMFCVQPIQATSEIQVVYEEHDLNVAYQKEFQRSLPYIYAKRIAVDSKNKEFYALRSAKIILVKEALSLYKIGDDQQQGMLQDYELIYKDRVAYIKIPMHIRSINELKESVKFRGAVAEVITTILDVDGDKDAFLIILACKSTKEAEEYFIENGDDDLSTVNLAKAKFSEQIDRKIEFWNAIENALGVEKIDQSQYTDLMIDFDYNNLNCFSNCPCIIKLFKKLGINVEHYNQYAFESIDLQPYYKEELRQIKQKYREKYFIYSLVRSGRIKTKFDFEVAKQNYDELTLVATNSVDAQLEKIFENNFGVSVSVLNGIEGSLDELLKKLIDESQEAPTATSIVTTPPAPKVEVNYDEINAQIASNTNAESKKVGLSALSTTTRKTVGSKKKGGTYDSTTTKSKEENGFIAESKVYHTLRTRIGSKGSVVWVSGNGYRAHENEGGDDSLGYDIWYSDERGKKHYVEVKGSTSENVEFVLTKNELEFAEQHAEEYEIWYVRIVDKQPTIPYELGNLLLLGEEETFFNNSKFAVENSEFRIRATANEQVEE